jgi:hypothetical protein
VVRLVRVCLPALFSVVLWGHQAVAQSDPYWPPEAATLQPVFILYFFSKDPVFWLDGQAVGDVLYREGPNNPELQQVARTTTGFDVLMSEVIKLKSFEVTNTKEGVDSNGVPTYAASYHAQFVATMAFFVVHLT